MTWFKMDDKFHSSEPVRRIPREIRMAACGLFAVAGTWSADHLKDGLVPDFMLEEWGATIEQAQALVKVGLWRKARNGYRFREWSPWQPTRAEIELNRAQERDRKKAYRASKQQNTGVGPEGVPVGQIRIPGHPDPTRPDPTRPDHTTHLSEVKSVNETGPFCARHPNGTDAPCGPCRTARIAYEAKKDTKPKAPTTKRLRPGDGHEHKPDEHGYCPKCGERA